ncbi:tRNA dimethylallyltransferase [Roseivirga ehrenbergii]|uniref:tRNA dimethylallyltransferase n=1 Tax=Roseivirga ehrenbergii (strain DSM 102268 / JCM 13514 / KCTC 12282 / NCIMB 14502 / KMM 6017) TaxID=279360 RepID=A0A150WZA1_ROSEK|nr:tRNA (adenosine(37)-N6)-dimethylallyltransferase MiaA [Roseivirga ehrenbergii]KYG71622.1 tRNA dimethylallyltransferase [Roseivirga ehrenbergii]TCL07689.1 tRNA dimethylallyltransferase [Roseivirga ehrenbergii]
MTIQIGGVIKFNFLICVVGPTAVGKTAQSIILAKNLESEIVSADSRQFYRELEIGTAKPSNAELSAAKHHLINSLSIRDHYDVGKFENDALKILKGIFSRSKTAIMVGGSGLFVDAVCYGLDDLPQVSSELRNELTLELNAKGLQSLVNELMESDPEYCKHADLKNPQRVIRALEVVRSTGKPFSSFRTGKKVDRPFHIIMVGLEMEREKLYERIDLRMDQMIENGLFEEAEKFYTERNLNALQTVGYKEIFGYLAGEYDKEEAIRLLKRNSRRYAKRQMTWFKKNEQVKWFEATDSEGVLKYVMSEIESKSLESEK